MRFSFDRVASVAAMQEQVRISQKNLSHQAYSLQLWSRIAASRSIRFQRMRVSNAPKGGFDRFQSACKMQYDADVGQLKPPTREEAM
jgi:hypothetical protein